MLIHNKKILTGFLIFFGLQFTPGYGQDPTRFQDEVHALIAGDPDVNKKKLILFTGSSSVRRWTSLTKDFPQYNVLNRGFGGSVTTDLIYYVDTLIVSYHPKKVLIYEGDNDINAGKTPEDVMQATRELVTLIKNKLPKVKIFFISPKPSISRWSLKEKYEAYNQQLKSWTSTQKSVSFIDVWTPMLDSDGVVLQDIFVEDNLHMNDKGYSIWARVLEPYLK